MSEVLRRVAAVGPGLGQPPLRRVHGRVRGRVIHLLAEVRPEGLLERGGERQVRTLRSPGVADPVDRRRRHPATTRARSRRVAGNSVASQPATQPSGERRSTQQQGTGPIGISGVSRQLRALAQRLGARSRAPRSHTGPCTSKPTPRRQAHASLRLTADYRPVLYVCRGSHHNRFFARCKRFSGVLCRRAVGLSRRWID